MGGPGEPSWRAWSRLGGFRAALVNLLGRPGAPWRALARLGGPSWRAWGHLGEPSWKASGRLGGPSGETYGFHHREQPGRAFAARGPSETPKPSEMIILLIGTPTEFGGLPNRRFRPPDPRLWRCLVSREMLLWPTRREDFCRNVAVGPAACTFLLGAFAS